jgi:uncharacterized membrane protein
MFTLQPHHKNQIKSVLRPLATGFIAILPLAATLTLIVWAWRLIAAWLGPESFFGSILVAIGVSLTGSQTVGYFLGLLVLLALIYGLGVMVEAGLQRGLKRAVDALILRIPLVRTVYDLVSRMVDLFSKRNGDGLGSMSPVWLHFGGKPEPGSEGADAQKVAVLALLCTPDPVVMDGGRRYLGVLIPTAPVPVGGGLLYVPEEWVTPADVGVEGVTSIYVSMGLTTNQYVKPEAATVASSATAGTTTADAVPRAGAAVAPPVPPATPT